MEYKPGRPENEFVDGFQAEVLKALRTYTTTLRSAPAPASPQPATYTSTPLLLRDVLAYPIRSSFGCPTKVIAAAVLTAIAILLFRNPPQFASAVWLTLAVSVVLAIVVVMAIRCRSSRRTEQPARSVGQVTPPNVAAPTRQSQSASGLHTARDREPAPQAARDRDLARRVVEYEDLAPQIVTRPDVKAYLCPALKSGTNDVYDIAKTITPILVPMILAGTIAIPLNPVLFAASAVVIARMGVASFCSDHRGEPDKKQDG